MDLNKIVNDAVKQKEKEFRTDEILYNNLWDKINGDLEKDIGDNIRWYKKVMFRFRNQKVSSRLIEGVLVFVFIAMLIVIPTAASKYGWNKKASEELYKKGTPEAKVSIIAQKKYKQFSLFNAGEKDYKGRKYNIVEILENVKEGTPCIEECYVDKETKEVYEFTEDGKFQLADKVDRRKEMEKIKCNEKFAKDLVMIVMDELVVDSPAIQNDTDNSDENYFAIKVYYITKEQAYNIENHVTSEMPKEPQVARYYVDKNTLDVYKEDSASKKKVLYFKNEINNSRVTGVIKEDINGDGKKEEIKYDTLNGVLSINDVRIRTANWYLQGYYKDGSINVIDINPKDKIKEIVLENKSKDFYYYDGQKIIKMSSIKDCISLMVNGDKEIEGQSIYGYITDGTGKFTVKSLSTNRFFQYIYNKEYGLTSDHVLQLVPKEYYKSISSKDLTSTLKVRTAFNIQASKTDTKVVATLNVGEKITLIGGDGGNWCLIENAKGIRGWFEMDGENIKGINLNAVQVLGNWSDY